MTTDSPTPERLMQLAWGYAPPLIIETALRLSLFDLLDDGSKSLEALVEATGASERGLKIILNALTGLGFLSKADGQYGLTPESAAFLVTTKPSFQGGIFKHVSTQLLPKWLDLTEITRTGLPARTVEAGAEGVEFFQQFVEDIFPMSYLPARALAEELKVSEAKLPVRVLDIAAGSGVWGIALAQASKKVEVTALDWPEVLTVTSRMTERCGVREQFWELAGDLNTIDFGIGYDIALLGHIIHSEGDESSRELLKKTAAALNPGGTIAIAEFLPNNERTAPPIALIFAVNMLVNTTKGDTFTFEEIRAWLEDAGFEKVRTLDIPGPSPLILANKKA